jgi:hypothetical protein
VSDDFDTECDYCQAPDSRYIRFLGLTEFEGKMHPLVKVWCGSCETGDTTDAELTRNFLAALKEKK